MVFCRTSLVRFPGSISVAGTSADCGVATRLGDSRRPAALRELSQLRGFRIRVLDPIALGRGILGVQTWI